jgi:hypothetical protein
MKIRLIHVIAAGLCAGAAGLALAQTAGQVRPVAPVAAPAPGFGLPAAGGLTSPFPAGLTAGVGLNAGTNTPAPVVPGTGGVLGGGNPGRGVLTAGTADGGSGAPVRTDIMGAGPADLGSGKRTAGDFAGAFLRADVNADRSLTRAEALRVPIDDFTFSAMDASGDGLVSRGEYDDAMRGR